MRLCLIFQINSKEDILQLTPNLYYKYQLRVEETTLRYQQDGRPSWIR